MDVNASVTPNESSLEAQKTLLEIAVLTKQVHSSRFGDAFVDKWIPSIISAIVLFTLVPLANFVLWKSQKSVEIGHIYLTKKIEVYSDVASNATRFTQVLSYLNELYDVRDGKLQKDPLLTITNDKEVAKEEIISLEKERRSIEPLLVKTLRDVKVYFSAEASKQVDTIRDLYNNHKGQMDSEFIKTFGQEYDNLSKIMENEIQRGLHLVTETRGGTK